jgi:hypothetical protein
VSASRLWRRSVAGVGGGVSLTDGEMHTDGLPFNLTHFGWCVLQSDTVPAWC